MTIHCEVCKEIADNETQEFVNVEINRTGSSRYKYICYKCEPEHVGRTPTCIGTTGDYK